MILPKKTAKTIPQTALKSKKLPPGLQTTHIEKTRASKPEIEDQKWKNAGFFHFYLAGPGRAHARTNPKSTVIL